MARWFFLASVNALAAIGACGPSYQALYEGNLRFEHCYRLDLEGQVSPKHRERCWREWLQLYTFGQTRDRVEYAKKQLRSLAAGEDEIQQPDGGPQTTAAALAPTNPHAPPPPTTPTVADAATPPSEAASADAAPPPGDDCMNQCRTTWRNCVDSCDRAPGSKQCARCGKDYRKCMKRCFK